MSSSFPVRSPSHRRTGDAELARALGEDVADQHARVERRPRVLEHDLQLAPRLLHLRAVHAQQVQAGRQRVGTGADLPHPLLRVG